MKALYPDLWPLTGEIVIREEYDSGPGIRTYGYFVPLHPRGFTAFLSS